MHRKSLSQARCYISESSQNLHLWSDTIPCQTVFASNPQLNDSAWILDWCIPSNNGGGSFPLICVPREPVKILVKIHGLIVEASNLSIGILTVVLLLKLRCNGHSSNKPINWLSLWACNAFSVWWFVRNLY